MSSRKQQRDADIRSVQVQCLCQSTDVFMIVHRASAVGFGQRVVLCVGERWGTVAQQGCREQ